MSVIFLFIDGIGLGKPSKKNPFYRPEWQTFQSLTGGSGLIQQTLPFKSEDLFFSGVDATLGVKGLPQSGTGQASLFTGINAAETAGKHFGPYPHSTSRSLLETQSLFHKVTKQGGEAHFINGYPDLFFEIMKIRNRWTCTTLMAESAGQKLNRLEQVQRGESVTADIVQSSWSEQLNLDVETITEMEAAERVTRIARKFDLVLFEYYLTDKAGHSRSMDASLKVLQTLDSFIGHLVHQKREEDYLVISSDHGNMEDLSVKTHTLNPVPLIVHGNEAAERAGKPESILDLPDVILRLLQE